VGMMVLMAATISTPPAPDPDPDPDPEPDPAPAPGVEVAAGADAVDDACRGGVGQAAARPLRSRAEKYWARILYVGFCELTFF
jgi:hypothetical protein